MILNEVLFLVTTQKQPFFECRLVSARFFSKLSLRKNLFGGLNGICPLVNSKRLSSFWFLSSLYHLLLNLWKTDLLGKVYLILFLFQLIRICLHFHLHCFSKFHSLSFYLCNYQPILGIFNLIFLSLLTLNILSQST